MSASAVKQSRQHRSTRRSASSSTELATQLVLTIGESAPAIATHVGGAGADAGHDDPPQTLVARPRKKRL